MRILRFGFFGCCLSKFTIPSFPYKRNDANDDTDMVELLMIIAKLLDTLGHDRYFRRSI